MGNIASTKSNQRDSQRLEELIYLTKLNFNTPYHLSFNPFNIDSQSVVVGCEQHRQKTQPDLSISERLSQDQKHEVRMEREEVPMVSEDVAGTLLIKEHNLQKNQISEKKNTKKKQIRKPKKCKKMISELSQDEEEAPMIDEAQITTAPDEGIRDQNNCKSYHKLVKNYLQSKNLGQMIDKYEKKYHTRYYFIVALILIKYYVNDNFTSTYAEIVQEEIKAQQKKIEKKQNEKEKLQKKRTQLKKTRGNSGNTEELQLKRKKLQNQISHIEVVKYEIKEFSMRSCATFFQGDIEESLKILYMKDDPVMRKKYYFDSALQIVKEIQAQVRKANSRS